MYPQLDHDVHSSTASAPSVGPKSLKKQVRIIKKIRTDQGVWSFVSLLNIKGRYVWDKREGHYFIEW